MPEIDPTPPAAGLKPKAAAQKTKVIRISRHIAGPPRRAPGQTLVMTADQIRQQGLKRGDYTVVK